MGRTIKETFPSNKIVVLPPPVASNPHPKQYNTHDTGVFYSCASNIYFSKEAPIRKFNAAAPKVHVGTSNGQVQQSVGMGTLALTNLPSDFPCTGHVMPLFKHDLVGIGSICDADCKVVFTKQAVVVYNPQQ